MNLNQFSQSDSIVVEEDKNHSKVEDVSKGAFASRSSGNPRDQDESAEPKVLLTTGIVFA